MPSEPASSPQPVAQKTRVRVFVDYWNFQLRLHERGSLTTGDHAKFNIDWKKLGPWLAAKACAIAGIDAPSCSFEGMGVYSSYDPKTQGGRQFRSWLMSWMNRQPGIDVQCLERKAKARPRCPICHRDITHCPHQDCGQAIAGTVEKGVDTLIATDMIRLAWEQAYDIAVIASLDADLVPAVEFLNLKGRKIIQAGFPPQGVALATACWGSFDVARDRSEIEFSKN